MDRYLLLTGDRLGVFSSKTASGLLRYRPECVVAVLDRKHAGRSTRELLGIEAEVPVVATLEEGLAYRPTALVIGIAPMGGQLPPEWRETIHRALAAGLDVVSTLHEFLADDPEFAAAAARHGRRLIDLRRPPPEMPIGKARARGTRAYRVLTVGTDCNVGKKAAALEIQRELKARGRDARFLATGQTGILISGSGVAIDRVIGDFMAGIVEQQALLHGGGEWLIVEGQGAILHPGYSGVTAALLHGALPQALVLCHQPGREAFHLLEEPLPPLPVWIAAYEALLRPLQSEGRVAAVAVNTYEMEAAAAREAIAAVAAETGLPATDAVRFGAGPIVDVLLQGKREG